MAISPKDTLTNMRNAACGGAPGASAAGIAEDGVWGCETTTALQNHYGLVADGEIWHQWAPNVQGNPALGPDSWKCDQTSQGSPLIRAMQADLGTETDGIFGPQDVLAIKRLFGGKYGAGDVMTTESVWELQHQLNGGIWPKQL